MVTRYGTSRRWVVCRRVLRQHRSCAALACGPATYRLPVGAALCGALVEGADAAGRWRDRDSRCRDASGTRGHSDPCPPGPAIIGLPVGVSDMACPSLSTV